MSDPLEQDFRAMFNTSATIKIDDPMWQQLEIDLKKKEFYKFSFVRFNIYYALMMFASLGLSAFMVYDYMTKKPFDSIVRDRIVVHETVDTVFVTDKVYVEKPVFNPHSTITNKESEVLRKEVIDLVEEQRQNVERTDVNTVIDAMNSEQTATSEYKDDSGEDSEVEEPVVIHVKDTIVEVDSVKVSRRKFKKLHE